jgi:hypothetical protein
VADGTATGPDNVTTPAATLSSNATTHHSSTATVPTQSQNAGRTTGGAIAAIGGAVMGVIAML